MASVAQSERATLCDLALELGPDAPTMCEGWTTFDLVTHLLARERHPLAGLGIVVSSLSGLTDKAMAKERRHGFEGGVELLRSGPPFPMKLADELVNTAEYFVHVEDLRRANGMTDARADDGRTDDEIWKSLKRGARLLARRVRFVNLELERDTGERVKVSGGKSGGSATLTGRPGELTLYLMGRKDAAHVELSGDDDAVAFVRSADLSA